MGNLGDGVYSELNEITKRMLDILMFLLKWLKERSEGGIKIPVRFGKISRGTLNRMEKTGDKPRAVQIPRDKLDLFNRTAKEMGAQYFIMNDYSDSKTVTLAVPESSLAQINDTISMITQKMLTDDKESVNIHGREEAVSAENKDAVNEALTYYDVPVFRFERPDGSQVNIVPKEAEEDYKSAVKLAEKVSERIKNDIYIEKYVSSEETERIDHTVRETEPLEAANLAAEFGDEIEIFSDGEIYAVKYPDALEEKINSVFGDVESQVRGIQTAAVDNSLSIDRGNIERETEKSYLVRIPGTDGQDHMWIDKELVDSAKSTDKTLRTIPFIDPGRMYRVCDRNGQEKKIVRGTEMLGHWNTRNILGNKSSKTTEHGTAETGRIEVYDPIKNRLFRIEPNAETARQTLIGNGFSPLAADRILADVSKKMTPAMKDNFGFEKFNINSSSAVRKTDKNTLANMLRESAAAHRIKGAEFAGYKQSFSGNEECICIHDRESKKYTVITAETSSEDLKIALREMGCTDIEQNVIREKTAEMFGTDDIKKGNEPQYFDSDMAELRGFAYVYDENTNAAVFVRPNEDGGFDYAVTDGACTREELEKVLTDKKNFGLSDKAAAQVISECCSGQNPELSKLIDQKDIPEPINIANTTLSLQMLTSKTVEIYDIESGDKGVITEISKIDADFLQSVMNLDPKLAETAAKAVQKGLNREKRADGRRSFGEAVSSIIKRGKEKKKEESIEKTHAVLDEKGKVSETISLNKSVR